MTPDTYDYLLERLTPAIQKQESPFRCSIPPDQRLSVTLKYLATGMF